MDINANLLQLSTFLIKKTSGSGIKNENIPNIELAKEFNKSIIRKCKKKEHSFFIDNIWGADFADMQLISTFNKRICFLLCVINIFSKYVWVIPSKNKKGTTITNVFQNILDESNCKPNKIWVDKSSKFYNRSMKSFLQNNNVEMYSTNNEEISVFLERFIRTLKNKIYKYMTSISKNVYIEKLDDIVNKYHRHNKYNIYHKTIKMKLADVNPSMYIDFDMENNKEGTKLKVRDNVRISKYKNILAKEFQVLNWSEEISVIKKVKNTVPWTYVISDLNGEEIVGTFDEKELQKIIQKEFRIEKVNK